MGSAPRAANPSAVDHILPRAARNLRRNVAALAEETARAIQERVPEYARPADENFARTVRAAVEQAMRGFLDLLEQREVAGPDLVGGWREAYRAIGAGEMREGRSLDALQTAIRVGARVGWRELVAFAEAESLPVSAVSSLADAIWAHIDDLLDAAAEGYADARAAVVGEVDRNRRRLLDLLVADPPAGAEVVAEAARAAHWPLPKRLAAVALQPSPGHHPPPVLSPEVLADLDPPEPA